MAIDTAQKRAAALGVCTPTVALVIPSGGVTTAVLRTQVAGGYLPEGGGGLTVLRRARLFASRFRRIRRRR